MSSMNTIFSGYESRLSKLKSSNNPYANGVAWVEGQYYPLHEARIPLLDQGFLRGDLTYDVPSVWDGRFFRLDDHLTRLEESCEKMRLRSPLPREEVKRILIDMVAKSGIRDAFVELIITRGFKQVRGSAPEDLLRNNLYMFIQPFVWVMDPSVQGTGGNAVVARTVRRTPPGAMDPTIKNLQWGDLTRGLFEARDRGAIYPFLTDGDTNLTEGAGFNIFIVKDGVVYTPDRGMLVGVTRRSAIEVAQAAGIEVRIQLVPVEMAYTADEIFMCTTAGGVMPITTLDHSPVNTGELGPITKLIWDGYWDLHWNEAHTFSINYEDVGEPEGAVAHL